MADTLSRYPPIIEEQYSSTRNEVQILTITYVLPYTLKTRLKNINIEQQRDAKLKKISDDIRVQDNPKYKIDNDVLYKIIDGQWKIMVPDELVEDLTWACHESLAHAGAHKCYLAMRQDLSLIHI